MACHLVGAKPLSEPMLKIMWNVKLIIFQLRILLIWPLGTEIQWNTYWNSYIFIQENVYEMLAILSRLNVLTQ